MTFVPFVIYKDTTLGSSAPVFRYKTLSFLFKNSSAEEEGEVFAFTLYFPLAITCGCNAVKRAILLNVCVLFYVSYFFSCWEEAVCVLLPVCALLCNISAHPHA